MSLKIYKVKVIRHFIQEEIFEVEAKSESDAAIEVGSIAIENELSGKIKISDAQDDIYIEGDGCWNDPQYD